MLDLCRPDLEQAAQKNSILVEAVGVDDINVVAEIDFRSLDQPLDAEDDDRQTMIELRPQPNAGRAFDDSIRRSSEIHENQPWGLSSRTLDCTFFGSAGVVIPEKLHIIEIYAIRVASGRWRV